MHIRSFLENKFVPFGFTEHHGLARRRFGLGLGLSGRRPTHLNLPLFLLNKLFLGSFLDGKVGRGHTLSHTRFRLRLCQLHLLFHFNLMFFGSFARLILPLLLLLFVDFFSCGVHLEVGIELALGD